MEKILTVEILNYLPKQFVFAQGEIEDSPNGINISNSGKMLRWVAKTGAIGDWCIYCHFASNPYEWIEDHGDKIFSEHNIKKLIPCNEEAFRMYRY